MNITTMLFAFMVFMVSVFVPLNGSAQPSGPSQVADRLVDLKKCIDYLEKTGNLVRVKSEVDAKHELAGIAKMYEGKKCVFFEKVKGSAFPVFIGLWWNRDTIGSLFNVPKEKMPFVIGSAYRAWRKDKAALPSRILEKGPANEVIRTKDFSLYDLPVPVHALKDGGPYFDASVMMVNDPETGIPNISIREMMVTGKDRLTLGIDPGRHLRDYLAITEKKGKPLEVTVNNGVGPAPWLASDIPKTGPGKATIANHIVGRPIDLIKAQTVSVPAFADAQFVIEGKILPNVREPIGPFAESIGYYGPIGKTWVMQVTAITHQKNPIFHSLLTGREVWNVTGYVCEMAILARVKQKVPDLKAVHIPHGGLGFYGAVIQLDKSEEGIQNKAIRETFNAIPSLQWVVAVDTDVNIYDPTDVEWAITTRLNARQGLIILKDQPGFWQHPMVEGGRVTKVGVDATVPLPRSSDFERAKFKEVNLKDYVIEE
jgi:2,5-furandicarboxylate decarboxylase 1